MNHHIKFLFLLLISFISIGASENQDKTYNQYFKEQEDIYQNLLKLNIPGTRPLQVNQTLAESVLANAPKEIDEIISDIEHDLFSSEEKNIIFHGPSGTGKSVLAQAIAVKSKTQCLFFNIGTISTEYKDSGVQNLNRIFTEAKKLTKNGKPCIIIFDEFESFTKKHVSTNHSENNILVSFWQELDKIKDSKILVIGSMNNAEDLPDTIINRSSMIHVPLSNFKQRAAILSYFLKEKENKYKLAYPEWLTAAYLAFKTKGFSNRDLKELIEKATKPVIKQSMPLDGSFKIVPADKFHHGIKIIKRKSIDQWKLYFKKNLRDPKIIFPTLGLVGMCGMFMNQRASMALQIVHQKENIEMQKKGIALQEKAMSTDHMAKQAIMNTSLLGIPIVAIMHTMGLPIVEMTHPGAYKK